jgi:uncharacterized membrane protein
MSLKRETPKKVKRYSGTVLCLFILLYLFSCGSTEQLVRFGVYQGMLPAASCPGIDYVLELRKDGSYLESMRYREHESEIYIRIGNFTVEDRKYVCLNDPGANTAVSCFFAGDSQLRMLDGSGNIISGDLAEYYILNIRENLSDAGNVIKVHGNEPFWGMTLIPGDHLHFKTLETQDIDIGFALPDFEIEFAGGTAYIRIEHPDMMFELELEYAECTDTMSDIVYPLRAELLLQDPSGQRRYKGCARIETMSDSAKLIK